MAKNRKKKKEDGQKAGEQDAGDVRERGSGTGPTPAAKPSKMPRLTPPVPRGTLDKVSLERRADAPDRSPIAADETRVSHSLVTARTGRRFGPPKPIRVRIVP